MPKKTQFRKHVAVWSPYYWAMIIMSATVNPQMRGWLASVIWFSHPKRQVGDELDRLSKEYSTMGKHDWPELLGLMKRIGLPASLQEDLDDTGVKHRAKQYPSRLHEIHNQMSEAPVRMKQLELFQISAKRSRASCGAL